MGCTTTRDNDSFGKPDFKKKNSIPIFHSHHKSSKYSQSEEKKLQQQIENYYLIDFKKLDTEILIYRSDYFFKLKSDSDMITINDLLKFKMLKDHQIEKEISFEEFKEFIEYLITETGLFEISENNIRDLYSKLTESDPVLKLNNLLDFYKNVSKIMAERAMEELEDRKIIIGSLLYYYNTKSYEKYNEKMRVNIQNAKKNNIELFRNFENENDAPLNNKQCVEFIKTNLTFISESPPYNKGLKGIFEIYVLPKIFTRTGSNVLSTKVVLTYLREVVEEYYEILKGNTVQKLTNTYFEKASNDLNR